MFIPVNVGLQKKGGFKYGPRHKIKAFLHFLITYYFCQVLQPYILSKQLPLGTGLGARIFDIIVKNLGHF